MLRGMKDGKQSDVVVMDFTTAFNKVSHTRLLHKIHMYCIETKPGTRWFRSFPCGRIQWVVVDGEASKEVEITSVVPQGSVLGLIFFLLYINDIAEYTKHSSVKLFASYPSPSLQKITVRTPRRPSSFGEVGG